MVKRLALWGLVALIVAGGLVLWWSGRGSRSGPAKTTSEDAVDSSPEPEALLREPVAPPEEAVPPPDTVGARTEVRQEPARPAPARKAKPERPPPAEFLWFGRVIDGETRAPLAEASYDLVEGIPDMDAERTWSPVQADGVIELRCTGGSTLFVQSHGYALSYVSPRPRHGEPGNPQLVELLRSASVVVRVRDERAPGSAAALVQVRADWKPFIVGGIAYEDDPIWKPEPELAGALLFEGLPPRVALTIEALEGVKTLHQEELYLEPGERRELEIGLYGGCTIAGRALTPVGTPVSGQKIWLVEREQNPYFYEAEDQEPASLRFVEQQTTVARTLTDEHGEFNFADISPGEWLVGPAAEDFDEVGYSANSVAPVGVPVTIQPGDRTVSATVTCWTGLYIRGRVLDSDGQPAEYPWLLVRGPGGFADCHDDGGGSFTVGPLIPGIYSLVALPTWSIGEGPDCQSDSVEARPGDEQVELRLRPGATVVATILDREGKPARPARAWLNSSTGEHGGWGSNGGETDKDGRAEFLGVLPGEYALVAVQGLWIGVLTGIVVQAGSTTDDLELTLELGANLTIARPATHSANGYRVRRDGWLLADGSFGQDLEPVEVVPAGDVVVEFIQRRSETDVAVLEQKTVTVQAGTTVRVEFSAPDGERR